MSSPIVQPSAFNVSKVSVSQPKILEGTRKMAYLNYGDARALVMQTPSLPSPFGVNVFDKEGPPKYTIDLAMRGYQGESVKVKAFYDALSALDEQMVELGVKNSKLWFKSDMKRELVSAFYTPCVRFGKDKDGNQTSYPPNIKIKLSRSRDNSDFECQFYDNKSKGDPHAQPLKGVPVQDMLVRKTEVTALIQCTGVWFAGGKFGLSWKAVQMRLDSVPSGIGRNCAIEEDGDAEDATATGEDAAEFSRPAGKAVVVDEVNTSYPAQKLVAESEDEEEDSEIAPAPVPKKTMTVSTVKKLVSKPPKK